MAAVATLRDIPDDIGEQYLPYETTLRQRQKARAFSKGSYVDAVKLFRIGNEEIQIKSRIFRSQRKSEEPHKIALAIDTKKKLVTEAVCSCKSGISGQCAHVLALLMTIKDWILEGFKDIPAQPSCTSLPQQWDKPRGAKIKAEPVSTMVIAKPGNINRKRKPITALFEDNRKIQLKETDISFLQGLKGCPLSYLVTPPEHTTQTEQGPQNIGSPLGYHIPLIKAVEIPGQQHTDCGDLDFPQKTNIKIPSSVLENTDRWSNVALSEEDAIALERNTRDQNICDRWYKERESRITASNFGRFMLRKACLTDKFLKSIFKPKPFKSAATSYGLSSEKVAKTMYMKKTNNHVHDCGFIVNPLFPFLGASPDGKICEGGQSGLLEVKCPFSLRNWTIANALESYEKKDTFFLENNGHEFVLKRNHNHWFQVQGQLLVSGANFCDFVTYTRHDLHILRILPDKKVMEDILEKLCFAFTFQEIKQT